jgi:hypothetical protein
MISANTTHIACTRFIKNSKKSLFKSVHAESTIQAMFRNISMYTEINRQVRRGAEEPFARMAEALLKRMKRKN